MKILIITFLFLLLSSCVSVVVVKNCKELGTDLDNNKIFKCEE